MPHRCSYLIGAFSWLVLLAGIPVVPHAADPLNVTLTMTEFRFTPDTLTLPADQPVILSLANEGKEKHEFESELLGQQDIEVRVGGVVVEGMGIEEVSLHPGSTAEISFQAKRTGEYRFQCGIKGHDQMVGTIRVE